MEEILSLLVLYDSPLDCPGRWVVREQRVVRGGAILFAPVAFTFPSLLSALDWLGDSGLCYLPRGPDDDPVIWGSWI